MTLIIFVTSFIHFRQINDQRRLTYCGSRHLLHTLIHILMAYYRHVYSLQEIQSYEIIQYY